ncbi:uncharacterized protein LOC108231805 isoform X2 [Kryptolebias marmoratus]|uniref:uncharacterized protein LOC108231805 isoform X2 n=1 Tax=Kryptolebias marmoratus TaxID=37003 RepID=UPI0018ACAFC6|nr:uncharacterized protein LOC108231805 isoform X2 [Kryptolebias marmoratus]
MTWPEISLVLSKGDGADFRTDSEMQSLTREDLRELFPGPERLKLRRTVFGIIHKRKPINVLLRELQGFLPHDSLRAALTNNGVLADYVHMLKDMKTQLNTVQSFIEAHIGLLEDISKGQPEQQQGRGVLKSRSASASCAPMDPDRCPGDVYPYRAQVMYQMVVFGKTFDAHLQLMAQVQAQVQDRVQLISCSQDGQIVIIFCPISSRGATDINAAMTHMTGDEPVILVSMHHSLEVRRATLRRTCSGYPNVVLHVSVFYHETERGLLRCQENNAAVSCIQNKLQEYSIPRSRSVPGDCSNADTDGGAAPDSVRLFGSSSSSSSSSSDSWSKSIWGPGE